MPSFETGKTIETDVEDFTLINRKEISDPKSPLYGPKSRCKWIILSPDGRWCAHGNKARAQKYTEQKRLY